MKTHIPTADGLACGTRSAVALFDGDLCERCVKALPKKLVRVLTARGIDRATAEAIARELFGEAE